MTRVYKTGAGVYNFIAPPSSSDLTRLYIDERMTQKDVALFYGVSAPTVRKWCESYNISLRTQSQVQTGHHVGEKNNMYGRRGKDAPCYGRTGEKHPMYGTHHTEGSKAKTSASLKGKMSGRDNPMWKGGMGEWHDILRKTPAYKNWRKAVFERDHFTCQMCGSDEGGSFQAHHIKPIRDNRNNLLLLDVNNGVTLCKDCHMSINKHEYDFVDYFRAVIGGEGAW